MQAQDKSTGALGAEPASAETAADRGWELFDQHRYKDAAALFRKAIALDGAYPTGYAGLGAVGVQLNLYGDSEPILAKAISLKPDYSEAIYYQGLVYASQHRIPEAQALLRKLRTLEPPRAKLLEQAIGIMTHGDKAP
jgi:tetratricopeptide (TPR) repeat protein